MGNLMKVEMSCQCTSITHEQPCTEESHHKHYGMVVGVMDIGYWICKKCCDMEHTQKEEVLNVR
jgi:hypothetical protein